MFVYVFRLNPDLDYGKEIDYLLKFLFTLRKQQETVFNYLPSKKAIVLGTEESVYQDIYDWVIRNITHNFEFEEHGPEHRTLNQFTNGKATVHYLLPLFEPESYLKF